MRKSAIIQHTVFASIGMILTILVVMAYYMNHPHVEILSDTWSYLYVVDRIQTTGQFVNFWRLPSYPFFITLIYAFAGQGNTEAVSIAQSILFVCATLEIYIITALIFKHAWIALLISLCVGCNLTLLSYIKPLMSESLGLWLVISLALSTILLLRTLRRRFFWLVAFFMFLLFMTRPEWLYFPPLLCAYILLIAFWRQKFLHLLPHVIAATALFYMIIGAYVYVNATQNSFAGVTWVQNINELGKILQYNMQNDSTSSKYATIQRTVAYFKSHGIYDPYIMMGHHPQFFRDNVKLIGSYSLSIILHHPVTYARNTIPLLFTSLAVYARESEVSSTGLWAAPLTGLQHAMSTFHKGNIFVPLVAIFWICALCIKPIRWQLRVQALGFFILLCAYGIIITTAGAYRDLDYMRIHVLFEPLMIILLWGTVLAGVHFVIVRQIRNRRKDVSLKYADEQDHLLYSVSK